MKLMGHMPGNRLLCATCWERIGNRDVLVYEPFERGMPSQKLRNTTECKTCGALSILFTSAN